jgi:hypothetical protein
VISKCRYARDKLPAIFYGKSIEGDGRFSSDLSMGAVFVEARISASLRGRSYPAVDLSRVFPPRAMRCIKNRRGFPPRRTMGIFARK